LQQPERKLTSLNIDAITNDFRAALSCIGASIDGKTGLPLLKALKRDKLGHGPYPNVTLFEAANRIMSDLVILTGVKALLQSDLFPFTEYTVEFGNEDKNGFDIRATSGDATLIGEAFNVAGSFFQGKKSSALRKIAAVDATYKVLIFNDDAVSTVYRPRTEIGMYYVVANIETGQARIVSPLPEPLVIHAEIS
jgi:hypothetical protein